MTDINISIVGVGNCASSLIQGLCYYNNGNPDETVGRPGIESAAEDRPAQGRRADPFSRIGSEAAWLRETIR